MPHTLTRLDRTVIALALEDPASSLNRQCRLARWLFGPRQGLSPLANPKLEALRFYVVLRRKYGGDRAATKLGPLRDAGYDPSDLSDINRLVDSRSAARRPLRASFQIKGRTSPMGTFSRLCGRFALPITILLYLGGEGAAAAQTPPPIDTPLMVPETVANRQDGPGEPGGPGGPGEGPGGDHIAIGVGAMYQPAYAGAKRYRVQPLPAIDIKQGMFFANFQNGIGVAPLENETLTVGAGIAMMDNYKRRYTPNRSKRVGFGAGARGFVAYRFLGLEATIGLAQGVVGGTKGMVADFSLSRPIMVNERLFLNPSVTARWGNAKHNNRFYGVNAREAALSGFREFRPGSGLLDAKAEIGAQYRLTEHIGLGVMGGVSTVLGDVKDSPIVRKKTAPYALSFLSYTF